MEASKLAFDREIAQVPHAGSLLPEYSQSTIHMPVAGVEEVLAQGIAVAGAEISRVRRESRAHGAPPRRQPHDSPLEARHRAPRAASR